MPQHKPEKFVIKRQIQGCETFQNFNVKASCLRPVGDARAISTESQRVFRTALADAGFVLLLGGYLRTCVANNANPVCHFQSRNVGFVLLLDGYLTTCVSNNANPVRLFDSGTMFFVLFAVRDGCQSP